jgi:hypothetical protein
VGRGLYALSEWGYMSGVVKDVIKKVLEKNGPMTKQEIVDKVMKERYVKENTILVNLQNVKYFYKDKEGNIIKRKTGVLMLNPELLMRGDDQKQKYLLLEFGNFEQEANEKQENALSDYYSFKD